jgi:alcohol dehydrogenase class IV
VAPSNHAGYGRFRDLGIREDELRKVADVAASRPGARANPRPATPDQILDLFRSIW